MPDFERIDITTAQQLIAEQKAVVVDIRDPESFQQGHIPGAIHLTDSNLEEFLKQTNRTLPLVVCCYHGNSSQGAAEFFAQQGFSKSCSLDGGYEAWATASPPLS